MDLSRDPGRDSTSKHRCIKIYILYIYICILISKTMIKKKEVMFDIFLFKRVMFAKPSTDTNQPTDSNFAIALQVHNHYHH